MPTWRKFHDKVCHYAHRSSLNFTEMVGSRIHNAHLYYVSVVIYTHVLASIDAGASVLTYSNEPSTI